MRLGEKLLHLRKSKGLSQERLSAEITVSRQAISKWELGESTPDVENIIQLSRIFDVTTDFLLDDELSVPGTKIRKDETESDIVRAMLERELHDSDNLASKMYNSQSKRSSATMLLLNFSGILLIVVLICLYYFFFK
ncbi:helix-turn-helix domain-containing protein [Enterococcus sp. HY326]|uniref:helix-turn-helix domain-containing protein n=1 Tax=Enterococcus sp. HY326 TaxID=2971265 RepID=UPI00223F8805|nr:helix-turn-helix transcriptional regulator [Enterococcus sp. HY326]